MDQSDHASKKRAPSPKSQSLPDLLSAFGENSIIEMLGNDPRPTFILDLSAPASFGGADTCLVYCNQSLKSDLGIFEQIKSFYCSINSTFDFPHEKFRQWTLEPARWHSSASGSACKLLEGLVWTVVTIRDRWNLVSGIAVGAIVGIEDLDNNNNNSATVSAPTKLTCVRSPNGVFKPQDIDGKLLDWTLPGSCFETTAHIEWVRDFDWGLTSLGDKKDWSAQFRLAINLLMADPSPAAMYWGQDLITIYNAAYIPVCAAKHPWALGRSFAEVYPDLANNSENYASPWDNGNCASLWENGRERGTATSADGERFVMAMHSDSLEEIFFSYTVLPVLEGKGWVGGFYVTFKDVTRDVLNTRRSSALRAAADAKANGTAPEAFWRNLVDAVSADEYDIVSVLAYSVPGLRHAGSNSAAQAARAAVLEAFSTVPTDERGVPCAHDLLRENAVLMAIFDEVLRTGLPQTHDINDATLAQKLMRPSQASDERNLPKQLAFCATDPQLSSQGIMVIAVHPLRPYDLDYQHFLASMARDTSASLAASDRARLAEQAIIDSELRFSQMTATSPAAHFEVTLEGQLLYVNDRWHALTGMPRASHEIPAMSWVQLVYEPDLPVISKEWLALQQGKSVSFEIRMKKKWQAINPFTEETLDLDYTWVLSMASQNETKNGSTIMGCLVEINHQKWAEDFHRRKTEEAIELKHQQERFIDMTSHEMRNPLSAIFQCSDSIVSLLENAMRICSDLDCNKAVANLNGLTVLESFKSCIEAAQTISLCAQHQKRIVDDVLVLSKMDACMIEVTPVDTNPKQILQSGLGIFASELRANDTRMDFRVDESYEKLGIDLVRLDPSRLLQVLINLTTNALKFTKSEAKERRIVVSLGASTMPPSSYPADAGFTYLARSGDITDPTLRPEWGSGDPIYLHVSVEDTGRGISATELKQLFMRFKQASPRTHVDYGGSGLGLHIARQLTEMQGGQIGVTSERGKGSNFSFYIKARRCSPDDAPLSAPGAGTVSFPGHLGSPTSVIPVLQQQRSPRISREPATVHKAQRLNVLVVEDNIVNQKVLKKQLETLGWNIHVANHGLEALDLLKQTTFWATASSIEDQLPLDLVLMDVEMPIMDGLTTTKEIRNLQAEGTIRGHVPIIAVSANVRVEQIGKAVAAGMVMHLAPTCVVLADLDQDDVVSKPFRIPQLVAKIEQLLERQ
jgi:signal transduction histidine kinase/CheY-like chemotaxis protein